jgi:RNA polymerase sigma factor (sigma-70 family)
MIRTGTLTDAEIINNLALDKEVDLSLKYLYRAHYELLATYVLNNNGSRDDASDIFQEVIIAFVNLVRAGKFRGEASVRTFLYSLTRNTWLNELKKRGRARTREMNYEKLGEKEERAIQTGIEYRQMNQKLMEVLSMLGENCKKILVLYYYENLSMKEILASSGYDNEQVVRNKKYKCLKKMEELIKADANLYQQLKNLLHE